MTLNPEIAKLIEDIRQDNVHGARWLTGQALAVMKLAIERSQAETKALFMEELTEAGSVLAESRPSMASITNIASRLLYFTLRLAERENDLALLKDQARSGSDEIARNLEESFRKSIMNGAGIIEKGDRLMTCSYSSTVCQALRIAMLRGKDFHIMVADSVFNGKSYGEAMAGELKSYEIDAEIISDSTVGDCMTVVNKVVMGADSLLYDGSLINGIPTGAVALAAKECGVSLFSLCETAKFDARGYLGQAVELEEGFDCVPPHLITGIISEDGMAKPEEIVDYIQEISKYVRALLPG